MRRDKGFSLIELLIVVAIILVIAAIAIPSLLRARISANESSAVSSVRQITTAQVEYASSYPAVGYAANLATLGPGGASCGTAGPTSTNACIVDTILASGNKSGYDFQSAGAAGTPSIEFVTSSAPSIFDVTGTRNFCMITDGVLRINMGQVAIAPDVATCSAYPIAQ